MMVKIVPADPNPSRAMLITIEPNVDLIALESRELQTNDELVLRLVRVTDRCPQSEPFLVLEVGTGQGGLEQLVHPFLNAK